MKKILLILLAVALPVLLLAAEPVREWKSQSGKTIIEVRFDVAGDSDPKMVHLLKDGKRYRVSFDKLSKDDQDYVAKARKSGRSQDEGVLRKDVQMDNRGVDIVPAGNRYALLIGVNEYNKPITSLRFCVSDMKLLAESFEKIGVPKENIFLVTDDSPAERRPTCVNIRQQIEKITQLMDANDQLRIAFGGHGVMVENKSYLCSSNTNLKDINAIVSCDWIYDQLEKCKAKQKVFIIDACRNELTFAGDRSSDGARVLEDPIGVDTHGLIKLCEARVVNETRLRCLARAHGGADSPKSANGLTCANVVRSRHTGRAIF